MDQQLNTNQQKLLKQLQHQFLSQNTIRQVAHRPQDYPGIFRQNLATVTG